MTFFHRVRLFLPYPVTFFHRLGHFWELYTCCPKSPLVLSSAGAIFALFGADWQFFLVPGADFWPFRAVSWFRRSDANQRLLQVVLSGGTRASGGKIERQRMRTAARGQSEGGGVCVKSADPGRRPVEYIFPPLGRTPRRVGHSWRSTASLAASVTSI